LVEGPGTIRQRRSPGIALEESVCGLAKTPKEERVNKKIFLIMSVYFLFAGCAIFETTLQKEQKYGKETPVIEQSFASPTVRSNDNWRIYLRAYDPNGDMKSIVAYFSGLGDAAPIYSLSLPKGNGKELSGYVYWFPGPDVTPYSEGLMTIQVEDMAGHFSKAVSFPVRIETAGAQQAPPQGVFEEKNLGPILIPVKTNRGRG
jgi:hypothetical protein